MKKRVFFLGSGFSKLAGFPLMPDFYEFLETHVNKMNGLKSEFDKIGFNICKEKLENFGLGNVSFSDGFSFLRSLTLIENGNQRNILDRLSLHQTMTVVAKAFLLKQEEVKKQIEEDIPDFSIYKRFYEMLDMHDTIISTNYDLLSELFLWRMNKWSFLDGYGFNISHDQYGISYPVDKIKHSKIKIHKIHGSLNWIPVEGNGISLRDTAYLFDVEGSNLPEKYSNNINGILNAINFSKAIVFPLYNESLIYKAFLLRIWDNAFMDLSKADTVFFIGYSFSNFDRHMFCIIRKSLAHNVRIYNINPDEQTSHNLELITEQKIIPVYKKFKDWDTNELSQN